MTDRMGTDPILPVKRSVSIDTMINFDGDGDRYGDGDGTYKQAFSNWHNSHHYIFSGKRSLDGGTVKKRFYCNYTRIVMSTLLTGSSGHFETNVYYIKHKKRDFSSNSKKCIR